MRGRFEKGRANIREYGDGGVEGRGEGGLRRGNVGGGARVIEYLCKGRVS